jgi:hypothetical protein
MAVKADKNGKPQKQKAVYRPEPECNSCGEVVEDEKCAMSRRDCGHHCNCSWTQDKCCWCGMEFGEHVEEPTTEQKYEQLKLDYGRLAEVANEHLKTISQQALTIKHLRAK